MLLSANIHERTSKIYMMSDNRVDVRKVLVLQIPLYQVLCSALRERFSKWGKMELRA